MYVCLCGEYVLTKYPQKAHRLPYAHSFNPPLKCHRNFYFHMHLSFFFLRFFLMSLLNKLQLPFSVSFFPFCPQGMWDLSVWTTVQTHIPCIGRRSLKHLTTTEVPPQLSLLHMVHLPQWRMNLLTLWQWVISA